jgi:hypothetical protein
MAPVVIFLAPNEKSCTQEPRADPQVQESTTPRQYQMLSSGGSWGGDGDEGGDGGGGGGCEGGAGIQPGSALHGHPKKFPMQNALPSACNCPLHPFKSQFWGVPQVD